MAFPRGQRPFTPGFQAPPALHATRTTWVWIAFAMAVVVATIVGLIFAGNP